MTGIEGLKGVAINLGRLHPIALKALLEIFFSITDKLNIAPKKGLFTSSLPLKGGIP